MKENKERFFKQFPEFEDNIQWAVRELEKRITPWEAKVSKQHGSKFHYIIHHKINLCRHN
mgnify:CR=1 FL=1